ncbi:flagellar filament capping protein FliD [Paenibacillus sp. ATY16]|uniref:flagellar filament capping protein FliD n=1 Tax=Paenibacillus sp. ATY16 TaxID=1759312 RepID=UPI000E2FD8FA|nr:flagellar filament capping protein FliD [Paenibacillus sp. ATY16]
MSTLRVTGLASGMDYESMIKQIMDAQRVPLDKLNQKKQINQWKQDDYRAINNKVLDFKNAAFDMKLQSAYLTKTASSSNTNVATVTGTGTAIEGSYTLQVEQLAKTATLKSGTLTGATIGKDTTITVNGVDVEVKSADTYQDLANKINAQSVKTGVKVAYDSTLKTMFFSSTKTGAAADIDLRGADVTSILGLATNGTATTTTGNVKLAADTSLASLAGKSISLTIDGQAAPFKFDITSTTTVGDLMSKMNDSLKNTGVSVSLNKDGNLIIDNPVKSKAIDFTTGSDTTVLDALGLTGATGKDTASVYQTGQNAKVKFNGVEGEYDSNTFTIAGLSITAKSEGTDVTNIGVTQDVDSVFNKIKSFVDKYNDLISSINSELSEEKYRDYAPLTDAQKKEMTDDQIKQWEDKAKSGMLANDSVLTSSLYSMRQALSSSISGLASGQLKNLSDIGISSSLISGTSVSGSYLDKGKLYIDETKLKQMISEKPDEVMALFTADDKDSKTTAGDGVATRLYNQASAIFSQIVDKAGTSTSVKNTYVLGKESLEYDKQISALQTRLDDMETRYYNQFTQMETYISQMNSRSSSLASLLGS